MKTLLASTHRHHGQIDFAPISRLDIHNREVTIIPSSPGFDPAPGLNAYPLPMSCFPGSAHNVIAIQGIEHQNGNLLLLFSHPDDKQILVTETPPYTVFWATDSVTDKAAECNLEEQKGNVVG